MGRKQINNVFFCARHAAAGKHSYPVKGHGFSNLRSPDTQKAIAVSEA